MKCTLGRTLSIAGLFMLATSTGRKHVPGESFTTWPTAQDHSHEGQAQKLNVCKGNYRLDMPSKYMFQDAMEAELSTKLERAEAAVGGDFRGPVRVMVVGAAVRDVQSTQLADGKLMFSAWRHCCATGPTFGRTGLIRHNNHIFWKSLSDDPYTRTGCQHNTATRHLGVGIYPSTWDICERSISRDSCSSARVDNRGGGTVQETAVSPSLA